MNKIALIFTLIFIFLIPVNIEAQAITPVLTVIEDSVCLMGQIDENTGLFWAEFVNEQDDSVAVGIYLYNQFGKYKFIALYLNFETDQETFILYNNAHNVVVGPVGPGDVKNNFVSWVYDIDIRPSSTEITFKHYKDFDINNKQGSLIMEYKVYLKPIE